MILITGANGFVGSTLVDRLVSDNRHDICVAVRRLSHSFPTTVRVHEMGDFLPTTKWDTPLSGVNVVVHFAARVHVMQDRAHDPLTEFRKLNVECTLSLARQAAALGVRHFVFISSIKVNGEVTDSLTPFRASDAPNPQDPYGISKMEAEAGLREICSRTGMVVTSVRPPLVYGPGVRANFLRLLSWVRRGVPLPFGGIHNKRSLVSVWNLCDLIKTVIDIDTPPAGVLMVSDGNDLSTPDLIRQLAVAMGRSPRLVHVPERLLRLAGAMTGKSAEITRICGSLTVNIDDTKRLLDWVPPISVAEGLARTARWYMEEVNERVG